MCGIRKTDSTWLREEKEKKISLERAEDSETSEVKEGRLSEPSVKQTVNSRQCTQLHNGDGAEAKARVVLLDFTVFYKFCKDFYEMLLTEPAL